MGNFVLKITPHIALNESELVFTFVRAAGPGGQNVNKVATSVQLRFNIVQSSALPEEVRTRLLFLLGKQVTAQGELIIKANRYRTQERNKNDAVERLKSYIKRAAIVPKKRKKTKPTKGSVQRRLDDKKAHGKNKALRRGDFT